MKATKWIASNTNKKGNIPRLYINKKPVFNERVDAIAQAIRLNFINMISTNKNFFKKKKFNQILNILVFYHVNSPNNIKTDGSFLWGKKSSGDKVYHSNSWVTFFAVQALNLTRDFLENKKLKFDYFDMV